MMTEMLLAEVITSMEQGSDEWKEEKRGIISASRFKEVISKGRSGSASKTRMSYMYQLAAEDITGELSPSFSNEYMEWGTATEPQAREAYCHHSGNVVDEVAFIRCTEHLIGISPDGLVGDDGGLEIKCPKTSTQIETVLSGKMPAMHKAQVQGSLWITGREWWDFVSFDPRINSPAHYFCIRIERDEKYISELAEKTLAFEDELKTIIKQLRG